MKRIFTSILIATALMTSTGAAASVDNVEVGGWFEGGYVTWNKVAGYSYNVYVSPASADSWTKLDTELVREYSNYGRADMVGLKAGDYKFKVVPVSNGAEVTADATVTATFTAAPYDRGGFAHFKSANASFNPANGIGAYKNDGTLKDGAKVFYVTADNAKTITTTVKTSSKDSGITSYTGFQAIIDAYQKGYDKTPLDFRIIGTVKAENMDDFSSSAEGLQIKGNGAYSEMNITIEGIGKDAAVHGFGFLIRNACSVELRNFAVMWCMDDAVSMDTDNSNLWVHNLDLFYGKPGGAADQKKGDGTLDIKGDSKYSTLSYNHLWDSGKSSLCGMKSESGPNYLTYHHNWFDHSDSRHPRIRTMSVHVYNNYYDGNSKYGIGATTGSDVFAENNYFRNCKYPMLTSKQGSDVHNGVGTSDETKGTFSGEEGGSIKAFGNYITGEKSFEPYVAGHATYSKHFDAYVVDSKDVAVPNDVVSVLGGNTYSNFDTDKSLMYTDYKVDDAKDVPAIVKGALGAGRCQHGDFTWTFGANEDSNDKVIEALSTAIQNYKSTLVGFFGKGVSNGGATTEQGGSSDEGNGNTGSTDTPSVDDDPAEDVVVNEPYIAGNDDFFFFNEENAEQVKAYIADGTITLVDGMVEGATASAFVPTYSYDAAANGKEFSSTLETGSLQLAKASSAGKADGGSVIFRCLKGVTEFGIYAYRTGSVYLNVYTSTDSVKWTKVATVEKAASGIYKADFSANVADTLHRVYVKVENTSTGGLNIQGVRICNKQGAVEMDKFTPTEEPGGDTGNTGDGDDSGSSNTGSGDVDANALYKFTVKAVVPAAVVDGTAQNYSDMIETQGGKFRYGNVGGGRIAASTVAAKGFGYKLDGDAKDGNTKTAQVYLDSPLKLGDKITLSCYAGSTPSNDYGLSIYNAEQTTKYATVYNTKKNVEETFTIDVTDQMVGLTTFYIVRNTGKSTYFTGITITGEKPSSTAIVNVNATPKSSAIYSIDGRQIANPVKGQLYIMGGKKFVK